MDQTKRRQIIGICIIFILINGGNNLFFTFMPLHLRDLAFGDAAIGTLMAIGPFVSIFAQPMWGMAADHAGNKSRVLTLLSIGVLLAVVMFLFPGNLVYMALALSVYAFFQNPMVPLIDTVTLEYLAETRSTTPYGVLRMTGTAAYVVMGLIAGVLSGKSVSVAFVVYIPLIVIAIAATFMLPHVRGGQQKGHKMSPTKLFKDKCFLVFMLFALVTSITYGFNSSFFPNYMRGELGASNLMVAVNMSLGAVLEVFLLLFIDRIVQRFTISKTLLFCSAVMTVRWLMTACVTNVWALIAVQFFTQPFSWVFITYCLARYVQTHVPLELKATGQTVMSVTMSSIARIIGSMGGGFVLQAMGGNAVQQMYLYMGIGLAVSTVLFAIAFGRLKPSAPAQQLAA
nr:MFS transporter [Maliibacterium massiliense]